MQNNFPLIKTDPIYPRDIRGVELFLVTQTIKNINPEVK